MRELAVNLMIYMKMEDEETYEDAAERFYNQLFEGICIPEDYRMDFEIYEQEEVEI